MGYMLFEPCLMDNRQEKDRGTEKGKGKGKKKGSTLEEAWPRPAFGK